MDATWTLSAAAALALRDPGRPNARDELRLSVKELVLAGVWRAETGERRRAFGRTQAVHLLVPGSAAVPDRAPLPDVHRAIADAPAERLGLVEGREIRALAKRFAKQLDLAGAVRDAVLADLERRGLVERRRKKRLRLFTTTSWERTPAGEQALLSLQALRDELERALPDLAQRDPATAGALVARAGGALLFAPSALILASDLRRAGRGAGDSASTGFVPLAGDDDEELPEDADELVEAADLGGLDTFDGLDTIDASFAESFDSSFNSGFSDGDGDGNGDGNGNGGA